MQPTKSAGLLKILSVSPLQNDHASLQSIVGRFTWLLLKADSFPAALAILGQHDISVVLCERDLMPGRWADVLNGLNHLPHPPSLIVTSRLADDQLWAEALNLGTWDVLAKPFEHREVVRSVKSAWQHWHNQTEMAARCSTVMRAAS
jgi:DNA-binding NtrC family response regulator